VNWIGLAQDGDYEHGNEHSSSIKCGEIY